MMLHDPYVVPERVADAEVYAVGLLHGLLGHLHALALQLLVEPVGVVRDETEREAGGALADQLAELAHGVGVHAGRGGLLQQDLALRAARRPHRQPAHGAEVDVGADLQTQLADVEVQRLVLVEHEHVADVYALDHVCSSKWLLRWSPSTDESLYWAPLLISSPKLLGRAQAMAKQEGTAVGSNR